MPASLAMNGGLNKRLKMRANLPQMHVTEKIL